MIAGHIYCNPQKINQTFKTSAPATILQVFIQLKLYQEIVEAVS